ncbi:MAG: VanZ family protein [Planctomycetota bacterium]|jgi:VanZ family protein
MALSLRQKLTVIALLAYWPALFILAHIPIPQVVYSAKVSDKSLHFAAYLILVFLLWFAVRPDQKVSWRKAGVWWTLLAVALYGAVDEFLQSFVGRSCDRTDFLANLIGVLTGLVLFMFLTFWPALLVVTGLVVFTLTNLARSNLAELLPRTSLVFYSCGYALFTLLWIRYMAVSLALKAPRPKWLIGALVVPGIFLLTAKLSSVILGKDFSPRHVIVSTTAIATVVLIVFLAALYRRLSGQRASPGDA